MYCENLFVQNKILLPTSSGSLITKERSVQVVKSAKKVTIEYSQNQLCFLVFTFICGKQPFMKA